MGVLGRFRWLRRLLIVVATLALAGTGVLTAAGGAQAAGGAV